MTEGEDSTGCCHKEFKNILKEPQSQDKIMWYYDIVEKNKRKTKNKDKPQEDTKEEETERGSSHEWRAVSSLLMG